MFPDATFREHQVMLSPGSSIVLYTNGVTDAVNSDGEEFGEERIMRCLASLPTANDAEGICSTDHHVATTLGLHVKTVTRMRRQPQWKIVNPSRPASQGRNHFRTSSHFTEDPLPVLIWLHFEENPLSEHKQDRHKADGDIDNCVCHSGDVRVWD